MGTYDQEHVIPPLPVPALGQTCQGLAERMRPLAENASDWAQTSRALEAFEQGDGGRLQQMLSRWQAEKGGNASWLRSLWDDRYLAFRGRLPVNMNYCFQLAADRWTEEPAAALLWGLACVLQRLRLAELPPECAGNGVCSMDMLTHTVYTRIPALVRDVLYRPSLALPMTAAVVCRGHWFLLSLTASDGGPVSLPSIERALRDIRRMADSLCPAEGVGAVTCLERDAAHSLRAELQRNLLNRTSLESIEQAVCAVCLDEPSREERFVRSLIAGDAANRWYDKSLQIIWDGKRLGINLEHTGCDAGIWVYLLDQIDACLREMPDEIRLCGPDTHLRVLRWRLSAGIPARLHKAQEEFAAFASPMQVAEEAIDGLSRERIKAAGYRPDALAQMLFQAAYYLETGTLRSVYEAVSTRGFYQGRTGCVRPHTKESAAFVRELTVGEGAPEKLAFLYQKAEEAHLAQVEACQRGMDPERHMTGLLAMWEMFEERADGKIPEIFTAPCYHALKHDAVSTSSIAALFIDYFAFGPVVEDGVGIGYGIRPDSLRVAVSAFKKSGVAPGRFLYHLRTLAERFLAP